MRRRMCTHTWPTGGACDGWGGGGGGWGGGGAVRGGGGGRETVTPPLWVLLMSPLGLLEPLVAYRLYALIALSATVGYLAWVARELRLRAAWAIVGGVMLLLSSPLLATLALGQLYPFLALGLVTAWIS